ncbi:MAG: flavin-containing monooxygenase [Gammaproteobacteria bacterium]
MTPAAEAPLDLLVVGAGLAGIGAAAEYLKQFPGQRLAVLESRASIGGTWDLFRYPGVRSDTDMFTLGYRIRPWRGLRAMMDGPSIRRYVRETAEEFGVLPHIRFNRRVTELSWDSTTALWTVIVKETRPGDESSAPTGVTETLHVRFIHLCTGYYSYAEGYRPSFPGEADFAGRFVHPQFWPQDLDYTGKRVVVIGSGATAVTLVPAMADRAAHVTQLQRSPTYVVTRPAEDPVARFLSPWLPDRIVFPLVRWKCILGSVFTFSLSRALPKRIGARLVQMAADELPQGYEVRKHFKPDYAPWDQRICAVPDGDLFKAISSGKVDIVTDHIERVVPEGIRLKSGVTLPADIVVTATGLKVAPLGGARVTVDGRAVELRDTMVYRGAMLSGVPNLVLTMGYTNASWTLRADLITQYVMRLVRRLRDRGSDYVVAERDSAIGEMPLLDFSSGYVQRAMDVLPKQGDRFPWRVHQNYLRDLIVTRYSRLEDPALHFRRRAAGSAR